MNVNSLCIRLSDPLLLQYLARRVFIFLGMVHLQSLVANEDFQHILRVLNTNVDGKQKIMFALTSIKGIGRRFANIVCKKADVDMNKRSVSFYSFLILESLVVGSFLYLFLWLLMPEIVLFYLYLLRSVCPIACIFLLGIKRFN